MVRLAILALLALAALANYADAQLFRGDRERVRFSFRSRRAAPRFGCAGPGCYQPIQPLFVQPSWGWQPRPRSIDFQFRNDGFATDFRFRSSRGDFCPWCR